MSYHVGLDVSLKETSVCVPDVSGRVAWRGTCKATARGDGGDDPHTSPRGRAGGAGKRHAIDVAQLARTGWSAEVRVKS